MKAKRVNPPYRRINIEVRCVDVFVEDESACKTAWTSYVSKIHVT
jgi:hypothetical protein